MQQTFQFFIPKERGDIAVLSINIFKPYCKEFRENVHDRKNHDQF